MMWFKSCPRCNGDLHEDSDVYGRYIACLSCGYYLTVVDEARLRFSSLETVVRPAGATQGLEESGKEQGCPRQARLRA